MLKKTKFIFKFILPFLKLAVVVFFVLDFVLIFISYQGYRFNLTNSMEKGIYKEQKEKDIRRNSLVIFCKNTKEIKREQQTNNTECFGQKPLLKEVVGIPGDILSVTKDGVVVNGNLLRFSKQLDLDINKAQYQDYKIQEHELFLLGRSPYSWDSRYFGIINDSEILFVVKPVFILESQYKNIY